MRQGTWRGDAADGSLSVTYLSTTTKAQAQAVFDVTGYFVPLGL